LNRGDGTFEDVRPGAGKDFQIPRAHRGSAFGDIDGDGKIDIVVTSIKEPTELWRNTSPGDNNWIILKLRGTSSNRDGIGSRIKIGEQYNMMTTAVGYASSSHSGVHFGLGETEVIERIEIQWPSGIRQVLTDVPVNQFLEVTEPKSSSD